MERRALAIDHNVLVLLLALALVAGGGFAYRLITAPVSVADTGSPMDPSGDPVQQTAEGARSVLVDISRGKVLVEPLARYRVAARVCGTKRYFATWESRLAPIDVCLSWGPLATQDTASFLRYSQGGRWYHFRLKRDAPLDVATVAAHSANTHVVPATKNLRRTVARIDAGDVVEMEGYLVNVAGKYRGREVWWKTSLTRDDRGAGACEILYLTSLRKDGRRYE